MSKEHKPLRLVKRNKTLAKKTKEQKETLLVQLAKYPILQTACDRADVGRSTYYLWRKRDKKFRKRADNALGIGKEFINDMAESQLIKAIQNMNMTGIIFWLKNHHSDYNEKIIHKHEIEIPEVPEEERRKINFALYNIGLGTIIKLNDHGRQQLREDVAKSQERLPEDQRRVVGDGKTTDVYGFPIEKEEDIKAKRAEAIKKLSPDEREFCRKHIIDPMNYKR